MRRLLVLNILVGLAAVLLWPHPHAHHQRLQRISLVAPRDVLPHTQHRVRVRIHRAPTPQRVVHEEAASRSYVRPPLDLADAWAKVRNCESGGNYADDTGNGYYGAYQFSLATWESVDGSGLPSDASPAEQDMRAQRLYERDGRGQWPRCGRFLP